MCIKEDINLDEIKSIVSDIYSSIEYIDEHGYVRLYDKNITEEFLKIKSNNIISSLENIDKLLDNICDIVQEQYNY